jgi:hypothetical protein
MGLLLATVGMLVAFVSTMASAHPLQGMYVEPETNHVFEIDEDGYVITDLNVSAEFRRPSRYVTPALCTVEEPLRKFHPADPYRSTGSINASGCPFSASYEVVLDVATDTLTVIVGHAQWFEIWDGACMSAALYSTSEQRQFIRR